MSASSPMMMPSMSVCKKLTPKPEKKCGRLPLDDEYKEQIRFHHRRYHEHRRALGRRHQRGHVLKEFAEDTPWIHLDIAGTAWMEDQKPWIAKGPSGIALRSVVEFVKGFAK